MRGFWYTLEAIIAGILIITVLVFIGSQYNITITSEDLSGKAYGILKDLDTQGLLRNYTAANDYEGLDNEIRLFSYGHSVQICDYSGTCYGDFPSSRNVWTGTYIVSGESLENGGEYDPHEVRLFLWQ